MDKRTKKWISVLCTYCPPARAVHKLVCNPHWSKYDLKNYPDANGKVNALDTSSDAYDT